MKNVISTEKFPIKMWLDDLEDSALVQARNLANLPFVHSHVALMPDAHMGYGMPIGGVIATKGVVIPNAVGVDIGCGMCATSTTLTPEDVDRELLENVVNKIRLKVPVGFNRYRDVQLWGDLPEIELNGVGYQVLERELDVAKRSLGTLGGGNHFIEIQKGSDGYIWVMVHSGSRNLGKQVADHYNKIAKELNEKWYSAVPAKYQLAFLPEDSEEGRMYIDEMQFCIKYAEENRRRISSVATDVLFDMVRKRGLTPDVHSWLDVAHNYAEKEHHFGKDVWVHRKGATLAREGIDGVIPGSQGTKSYIVRGKGNPDSFNSCSHGAGRVMGRKAAKRTLDLKTEQKRLDDQGIVHNIRSTDDLDEASGAYKPIDVVMANQTDLVKVVVELTPMAVIKG